MLDWSEHSTFNIQHSAFNISVLKAPGEELRKSVVGQDEVIRELILSDHGPAPWSSRRRRSADDDTGRDTDGFAARALGKPKW